MDRRCTSAEASGAARSAVLKAGSTRDTAAGYGWISIGLHWLTGGVVLTLWYLGSLSQVAAGPDRYLELIRSHMTLAILAYPLLWARVLWRLGAGHPGPGPTQHGALHRLSRLLHYLLVGAIAAMLVSGPLMVWSAGDPLRVAGIVIASPLPVMHGVHDVFRAVHGTFGLVILAGIVLHIAAVILHVAVMRDGSFDRIMVPERRPAGAGSEAEGRGTR